MKMKWFAVKTLYRTAPEGRPKAPDLDYDRGGSLVEERVVVFRAQDHVHAIAQAERDAKQYARGAYRNAYGQKVVTRYLGLCDSFEMFDSPGRGAEVFSETYRIPLRVRDAAIGNRFLGEVDGDDLRLRKQYFNAGLIAEAKRAAEARQLTARSTRRTPVSRGLQSKPRDTGRAR